MFLLKFNRMNDKVEDEEYAGLGQGNDHTIASWSIQMFRFTKVRSVEFAEPHALQVEFLRHRLLVVKVV